MTILLDASTIQFKMSGTGYYTLGMLRELLKMDSVECIHVLGGNSELLKELDNGKMLYHFQDEQNWHRLLNQYLIFNRPNLKGDVAIFPNYFMPPGFSIPSLVTIHDLSFISHPRLYKWKMRNFYRYRIRHTFANADRILTVSEESRKNITKLSGRSHQDVISISPGPSLPVDDFAEQTTFPSKFFLMNGNIEIRKNIIPVIKAFLRSDLIEHTLVIAGKRFCDDHYWKEFLALTEQSDKVIYLGYIDNQELKQWYAHTSGLVCGSFIEGFGIPALNAFSMHKPCMISNIDALKEAAGEHVILVDPYDHHSLRNGFRKLAEADLSDQTNASDFYIKKHDLLWRNFSEHLEEEIKKLAFTSNYYFSSLPFISPLKQSILKTLAYSSVFHAPIKMRECYLELPDKCTYIEFRNALRELNANYAGLSIQGIYIGLDNFVNSLKEYQNAIELNETFVKKHQKLIHIMTKLPWISGIYYSGGTVHANHTEHKDIDLFIVASYNRVWLLYTFLKAFAFITRSKELLCFNYLIDNDTLHISAQQDLYSAHQILHLKPAVSSKPYPDLKAANPWIYNFFPNSKPELPPSENQAYGGQTDENKKDNIFMEGLNLFSMWMWGSIWKRKQVRNRSGGIRWDAHQIKLHTNDHRPFVYQKFAEVQTEIQNDILKSRDRSADFKCA